MSKVSLFTLSVRAHPSDEQLHIFPDKKRPLLLSLINKAYENRETAQSGVCGLVSVMGALFLERDVAVELSTVLFCQVTHQLNTNRDEREDVFYSL